MKDRLHIAFPCDLRVPKTSEFVGFIFDDKGFRLHIAEWGNSNAPILEVDFGLRLLAQRNMDEGLYLQLNWKTQENEEDLKSIVIVKNSDFLNWFHDESSGIYLEREVFHIAILTEGQWVEVICSKLPELRWI